MALFLPALAAAGAALILGACSRQEKTPSQTRRKTDQYSPPRDTHYQKKCIADTGCAPMSRIAAAYDYVGYMYGPPGKVKYDEVLTLKERQYAEKTFGKLNHPKQIPLYLQTNQVYSLGDYATGPDHPSCRQLDLWKVLHAVDPELGEAYVIGSVHHCYEFFAGMLAATGVELKIAAAPEDWLFLVESSVSDEMSEELGRDTTPQDEWAILVNIKGRFHIPWANALVPVDHESVILELEKAGHPRLEQAKIYVMGQVNNSLINEDPEFRRDLYREEYHERSRVLHRRLWEFFVSRTKYHPDIELTAKTFEVPLEDLYRACAKYLKVPKGTDTATHYENILQEVGEKFSRAIEASNRLSVDHVRALVKQHGKKKVLVQLGANHAPLFYDIYREVQEFEVAGAFQR